MTAKKTTIPSVKLVDFPEEIDEQNGIKIYGETSWENQIAVLSHYLHNNEYIGEEIQKEEAIFAIREFIEQKKGTKEEITDSFINEVAENPAEYNLFSEFFKVPFPAPKDPKFTFIDLFAGMGGFRIAMQAQGGKCVFSSEWNKYAQKTYLANFGEMPFGDITKEMTKRYIPKYFDVLCAGFPCQPFSIAGVSKKKSLGRETGFKDKTQGTLFFDVADIISRHRPKAFFLENVKNLMSHDKGNTFNTIKSKLEACGYKVKANILNTMELTNLPQNRERLYIIGFLN